MSTLTRKMPSGAPKHKGGRDNGHAWLLFRLGEITSKTGSGSTPRGGADVYTTSGIPLIRSMNVHFAGFKIDGLAYIDAVEASKLDHVVVQAGDVLLNITGASIGRVTTAPDDMAGARVNQHVCIIRPKVGLAPRFLAHFLASPNEQARVMTNQVGVTRQALTKAMVVNWEVPVPPLAEQRRIVAEIEKQFTRLDAGIAALKRVQANLKRYRASVLKAACEGKLVPTEAELAKQGGSGVPPLSSKQHKRHDAPANVETGEQLLAHIREERRRDWQGRGKHTEPTNPETTNLPQIPTGWVWTTLDQLADIGTGTTPSRGQAKYYGGTIPWVTSSAVNAPNIWAGSEYVTGVALDEARLRLYPPGTLVIALYGEGKTRGNVSELQIAATINQALAALVFKGITRKCQPFVKVFCQSNYEQLRTGSGGAVQPNLNLGIIRRVKVPLPPLAEQTRIVVEVERRLSVADELREMVLVNLQRACRLRQAVLHGAFSIVGGEHG